MDPQKQLDPLAASLQLARLKMVFGFILIISLIGLAATIALRSVTEAESHGLMPLVTALATLAGGFSNWAFGQHRIDQVGPKTQKQLGPGEEGRDRELLQ
jgi:hypothetical protein